MKFRHLPRAGWPALAATGPVSFPFGVLHAWWCLHPAQGVTGCANHESLVLCSSHADALSYLSRSIQNEQATEHSSPFAHPRTIHCVSRCTAVAPAATTIEVKGYFRMEMHGTGLLAGIGFASWALPHPSGWKIRFGQGMRSQLLPSFCYMMAVLTPKTPSMQRLTWWT